MKWPRPVSLASALGFVVACSSLAPDVPLQVADITFTERIRQRFLPAKTDDDAYSLFQFLIGVPSTRLLAKLRPDTALAAESGALEAHGDLILTARLDPFDAGIYSVEGLGRFVVQTTAADLTELLFGADFDIGNADTHSLEDLQAHRYVTLPILHSIQLHPTMLPARTRIDEGGRCVIPIDARKRDGESLSCTADGIGLPHQALYYVRIHLKELVAGQVYVVDNAREHEVFRSGVGENPVFGCLRLEPAQSLKILDLRGRELVTRLTSVRASKAPAAHYDQWRVPDSCATASPAQPVALR